MTLSFHLWQGRACAILKLPTEQNSFLLAFSSERIVLLYTWKFRFHLLCEASPKEISVFVAVSFAQLPLFDSKLKPKYSFRQPSLLSLRHNPGVFRTTKYVISGETGAFGRARKGPTSNCEIQTSRLKKY